MPLPFDLGSIVPSLTGCNWETSTDVLFTGVAGSGTTPFPMPLPLNAALANHVLWAQAITVGATNQSTNAFAIGLGL